MGRYAWLTSVALCCAVLDATAGEISFARDIVPIFRSRCVMCHMPGSEQAGLVLHPKGGYSNLVDVKSTQSPLMRIAPGRVEDSYLYRKLLGTAGTGERMPFGDSPLSDAQIELVRTWIESGAKAD